MIPKKKTSGRVVDGHNQNQYNIAFDFAQDDESGSVLPMYQLYEDERKQWSKFDRFVENPCPVMFISPSEAMRESNINQQIHSKGFNPVRVFQIQERVREMITCPGAVQPYVFRNNHNESIQGHVTDFAILETILDAYSLYDQKHVFSIAVHNCSVVVVSVYPKRSIK